MSLSSFQIKYGSFNTDIHSTAICLELMEEKDQIRELQCGHIYHSACLNLWVERGHHDCPLCKYDILGLRPQGPAHAEDGESTEGHETTPPPQPVPAHIAPERVVVISNQQPLPAPIAPERVLVVST